MKALRIVGIITVILVTIFLGLALFLPNMITFRRVVDIEARPQSVFEEIDNLENWEMWSAFHEDTTMTIEYDGPQRGEGAVTRWQGENAGRGKQSIMKSIPYEHIETEIDFYEQGKARGIFDLIKTDSGTRVIWTYEMENLAYPLDRYFGLMAEGILSPYFEKSLKKLKEITEEKEQESNWRTSEITIEEIKAQPALTIAKEIDIDSIGDFLGATYEIILKYMAEKGYERKGPPFSVYSEWRLEGKTGVIAGIPTDEKAQGSDEIETYRLPGGKAAVAIHYGVYARSGNTHKAISRFISKQNLERNGDPWESYLNNPAEIKDTLQWETKIVYPVTGTEE